MTEETPRSARSGDGGDFEARLKAARKRLDDAAPKDRPKLEGQGVGGGLGVAIRIATELVSAVAVGVGIGWALDAWLETKPWFLVAFVLLGGAAGVLNVFRYATNQGSAVGYPRRRDETETEDRPGAAPGDAENEENEEKE